MEFHYIINIISVIIAFVSTYILYMANVRFFKGEFKNFTNIVVVISFFYLYMQVFTLYGYRNNYFGIDTEIIKSANMVIGCIIGILFIICALKLNRFSKKYGLAGMIKKEENDHTESKK